MQSYLWKRMRWPGFSLVILAAALSGCGGNSLDGTRDSGGSIPLGKVTSSDKKNALCGVNVKITYTSGLMINTTTDVSGGISLPLPVTPGTATIRLTSPDATLAPQTISNVEISPDEPNCLAAALFPANNMNVSQFAIMYTPNKNAPNGGDPFGSGNNHTLLQLTVGLQAHIDFNANGSNVQGLTPSWVVTGKIGTIASDGTFTAYHKGQGCIYGILGSQLSEIDVTVN